jgi:hypothetical protein
MFHAGCAKLWIFPLVLGVALGLLVTERKAGAQGTGLLNYECVSVTCFDTPCPVGGACVTCVGSLGGDNFYNCQESDGSSCNQDGKTYECNGVCTGQPNTMCTCNPKTCTP